MTLKLSESTLDDMPEMVSVICTAYSDPYQPFVDLMCPGYNSNGISREKAEQAMVQQYTAAWNSSPYQRWLKVVDTDSGEIVG